MKSLPLDLYRLVKPVLGEPLRDAAHAFRRKLYGDTSQLGEALVARNLVEPGWPRWVVDVGANDGVTASNSYLFVRDGWDAVLIEPNPGVFRELESNLKRYPPARLENMACSATPGRATLETFDDDPTGMLSKVGPGSARGGGSNPVSGCVEVGCDTLTNILERHGAPPDFGILSVDTEGHDLIVFESLDPAKFRPRLIITETDEEVGGEAAKRSLLEGRGYRLVEEVGVNTLWLGDC